MFKKITVKQKIYALAILGALLALSISAFSIYSIRSVGAQLEKIAEEDIPMTALVAEITVHQLEQAILFERAGRLAETMAHNNDLAISKEYEKSKKSFWKYAKKVDHEIVEALAMAEKIIAHEESLGGPQYIIDEFKHVKEVLQNIKKEHKDFDDHVGQVFAFFDAGRLYEAEKLAMKVQEEEEHLDHALEDLLLELERFTAEAALKAEKLEHRLETVLMVVAAISTIVFVVIAFFIVRGIVGPLLATKEYADALSNGDLDINAPTHGFEDEIADMMASLSVFKENAIESNRLREQTKVNEERAERDRKQAMIQLADTFEERVQGVIGSVSAASTELASTAESMSRMIEQSSSLASNANIKASDVSGSVNAVAAASDEMTSAVQEISEQVQRTDHMVRESVGAVSNADTHAQALSQSTERVQEVMGLISGIAGQINLLSLNATIESARAGEAGKGFAVVANEVKTLANQTNKSVQEIDDVVSKMNATSTDIVDALDGVKESVNSIAQASSSIAAAVEEQSANTQEMGSSIQHAASGADEIKGDLGTVSEFAIESAESSSQVSVAAKELSVQAERLDKEVREFLQEVRGE